MCIRDRKLGRLRQAHREGKEAQAGLVRARATHRDPGGTRENQRRPQAGLHAGQCQIQAGPGWPRLALADLTYQLPPCTLSSAGQPRPTPRLSSPPSAGLNDSPPDPGNGLWLPPSTTFYFATPAAAPTAPLAPPALTTIRSAINRRQPSNNTCIRSHTYPRRHRQERIHQHAVPRCTPARRDTQQRADQPIGNQKPAALNPPQQVHRTLRRRLLLVAPLNVLGHLRLGFLLLVKPGRQDRRGAVAVHLPVSYTHLTLPTNREV